MLGSTHSCESLGPLSTTFADVSRILSPSPWPILHKENYGRKLARQVRAVTPEPQSPVDERSWSVLPLGRPSAAGITLPSMPKSQGMDAVYGCELAWLLVVCVTLKAIVARMIFSNRAFHERNVLMRNWFACGVGDM